jgi:hypothetical protein
MLVKGSQQERHQKTCLVGRLGEIVDTLHNNPNDSLTNILKIDFGVRYSKWLGRVKEALIEKGHETEESLKKRGFRSRSPEFLSRRFNPITNKVLSNNFALLGKCKRCTIRIDSEELAKDNPHMRGINGFCVECYRIGYDWNGSTHKGFYVPLRGYDLAGLVNGV